MVGKKIHMWVQEYPLFRKGGVCVIVVVRNSVYGARCGTWMYRKGRSYLAVKQRESFTCVVEEKAHLAQQEYFVEL
jgi:hypothetical protein